MKASIECLVLAVAFPMLGLARCTTQGDCTSSACGTRVKAKDGCAGGTCGSIMKKANDCGACQSTGTVKSRKPAYAEINTAALATLLKTGTQVVLLDARVGRWDDGRRLPGAKTLAPDATEAQALAAIGGKNALVVTYCSNVRCPASKNLTLRLIELGFTNVLKYPEGVDDWQAAGHEVVNEK
jgi:rhodanese-related sulfurtransferase